MRPPLDLKTKYWTAAHGVHRLYCTNLPEKLQKSDLKLSLYTLFSTYGPVLDVVALKTSKMRGQAHIVYRDIQASTQAMRALQGFDFFGKELVSRRSQTTDNLLALRSVRISNMPRENQTPSRNSMAPIVCLLQQATK